MIATVLLRAGLDPTAVIGGRLNTLGSNAKLGTGDFIVVESDESDGSFLKLNPTVAVVTNIDREHLDHYRDLEEIRDAFAAFINKVPFYGAAILCRDDPGVQSILPRVRRRIITYGTGSQADLLASRVECRGFGSAFEVRAHGDSLGAIRLQVPGEHSVLNAMAAVAAGLELDVAFSTIAAALEDFQNADRRFQIRGEVRGILIVDDYGHHPTEVTATLSAARRSCDRRIVALFQPHRFTRTAALEQDFACCFSQADALIVLPIYPAGEEPIPGVTAERLVALIEATGHRDAAYAPDFAAAEGMLSRKLRPGDLLLTLGAGDVWKVGERLMRQWADAPESHA
jgi:UDP-N-acetylmuramate--alanine ligase